MAMKLEGAFYGYKHWTLEVVSRCFYVGKGRSNRPHSNHRSNKWHAIVKRLGFRVEVCVGPVSNQEACAWEVEQIVKENTFSTDRSHDTVDIGCNFTRGGSGTSGRVCSDITKQKLKHARASQVISIESREKIAATLRGRARNGPIWNKAIPLSDSHRKSIGDNLRGKPHDDERKARLSIAVKNWHAKRKQALELLGEA